MDKEKLIEQIRLWISAEDRLSALKAEQKQLNKVKKETSEYLLNEMKNKDIDEFNLSDRILTKKVKKTKRPLTKKHLIQCLQEYYKSEPSKAEDIITNVLDSRQEVQKEELRFKKKI